MNRQSSLRFAASVLAPLLAAATLHANAYHVDSARADDSGDGLSPATAWKTLAPVQKTKFVAGDTIRLKRGCSWSYQSLVLYSGGTVGKPVVMTGYGSSTAAAPLLQDTSNRVLGIGASHVVVENLAIKGARQVAVATVGAGLRDITIRGLDISDCAGGINVANADTVLIQSNYIHYIHYFQVKSGAIGIVLDRSKNARILDNLLKNCVGTNASGASDGGGIELFRSNSDIEIARNRAYQTYGFIEMGGISGDTIRNVLVHHNIAMETRTLAWLNLDTPSDTTNTWGVGYSDVAFSNNTFVQNRSKSGSPFGASTFLTDSDQVSFVNNIVAGDSVGGFVYQGGFRRANNLFWSKIAKLTGSRFVFAPGEVEADPLMVLDEPGVTYKLTKTSPAIDIGVNSTQASTMKLNQILLESSLAATAVDIGAVEFSSTADTPSAKPRNWNLRILPGRISLDNQAEATIRGRMTILEASGRRISAVDFDLAPGQASTAVPLPKLARASIVWLELDGARQALLLPGI